MLSVPIYTAMYIPIEWGSAIYNKGFASDNVQEISDQIVNNEPGTEPETKA